MFNTLPTRFRHYDVLKLLGGGGFGVVYLARDTKRKRQVVLKMLHVHLAANPDMVRRFVREAEMMTGLDHANIVRVNQVEDDPQLPFFEMEYVEGQTLKEYRGSMILSLPEALTILKQMAAALDAAHQQGIVHCDVKPTNVLIKADGQVKLTDFGIAKRLQTDETMLTPPRVAIGTARYMSPEQADPKRQHEIGPASDIYSLGVVAYEMLAGQAPFTNRTPDDIRAAHRHEPPPNPRTFNRYLSPLVATVLQNVLAKQPAQRYQSANHFVKTLENAGCSPPPTDPPITDRFMTLSGVLATPVTPTRPVTSTPSSQAPAPSASSPVTLTAQPAISKPMIIGFVIVALVAMIVGGVLRGVFFPPPEPEPEVVLATFTLPAEEPSAEPTSVPLSLVLTSESPPATREPTKVTSGPIAASESLTATSVSLTATSVLLTATSVSLTTTSGQPVALTATHVQQGATHVPVSATLDIGSTIVGQDGMTLLYVPEGEFVRGSEEGDSDAYDNEHPQRPIYLDAFWIDQTEVTNEMFATFLNEQGNQEEGGATWLEIDSRAVLIEESGGTFRPKEGFANHPVIEVTWYGAKAYCEWAGRRLPTEAEWEKAARGTDGRKYPWGNEPVAGNLVNLCDKNCTVPPINESVDDGYEFTAPVGSYPLGASPYGAWDMAGNVWEWVADWYDAKYYKDAPEGNPQGPTTGEYRAVRGGSWYTYVARAVRAGLRAGDAPAVRDVNVGLRCARSP